MASSSVNVVRYSALIGGVFYGIIHKRTLQAQKNERRELQARHHNEELISKAKDAWKQHQLAKLEGGVIMDPDDPNFDADKFIAKLEKDEK